MSALYFGAGSRIRTYEGIKPTDLQSVPFDRFGIPAYSWSRLADLNRGPSLYKSVALPLS